MIGLVLVSPPPEYGRRQHLCHLNWYRWPRLLEFDLLQPPHLYRRFSWPPCPIAPRLDHVQLKLSQDFVGLGQAVEIDLLLPREHWKVLVRESLIFLIVLGTHHL